MRVHTVVAYGTDVTFKRPEDASAFKDLLMDVHATRSYVVEQQDEDVDDWVWNEETAAELMEVLRYAVRKD